MKKFFYFVLCSFLASVCLSSCFSLMKADKMVYAGSIGKKIDAAVIDSVQKIEASSEK